MDVDFAKLKKKKKKKLKKSKKQIQDPLKKETTSVPTTVAIPNITYSYRDLLTRVYSMIGTTDPRSTVGPMVIPAPKTKYMNRRTVISNFNRLCNALDREPPHMLAYVKAELLCNATVDGNGAVWLRGRFSQGQIEQLITAYIVAFVTCDQCKSILTHLNRVNRLWFKKCKKCGSTRTVPALM